MKKLKPGYNPEEIQGQLVDKVCEYFGRVYNDAEQERHLSLRGHRPGDEAWQRSCMAFRQSTRPQKNLT